MDRLRDFAMPLRGDPGAEAGGLVGPMELPGAAAIGIVKTLGRNVPAKTAGKWGGKGTPARDALAYLAKKFPRLHQQVEFVMDDTLGPKTSASWSSDNFLPYRAEHVLEGSGRGVGKAGTIKLNPNIHMQGQGADDTVNSIAHELQHAADNLRNPNKYQQGYDLVNVTPFSYEHNPFENLANITGAMEQGKFLQGQGRNTAVLEDWAGQMRGRFPANVRDVIEPLLPKFNEDPEIILKALRRPNRFFANVAQDIVPGWSGNYKTAAAQAKALDKHLRSPDALRKAILATKKGR
jgi:hypothetical protein